MGRQRAWAAWLTGCALLASFATTQARADCRDDVQPGPVRLIGSGDFCVLGFCLYDAALWANRAPAGASAAAPADSAFALVLTYRRRISGARLVEVGMDEIRRLAPQPLPDATLAAWRGDMQRALLDVAPGDRMCGVFLPGRGVRLYANDVMTAQIDDPAFAAAFFGIWLDPRTRAGGLRKRLLGSTPPTN